MKQFIPANLDIDKLINEKPPFRIERFKRDNLIHIIHLITSIPATNKDLDIIDGFVPIYSQVLQKRVRNYRDYLDYLLDNDVLLTDDWYIKGLKSKGYKFTDKYSRAIKMIQVADRCLINAIKKESKFAVSIKKKYKHLIKWYGPDLQIDYRLATKFIEEDLQRKINNPTLRDFDEKTKSYKDPYTQYKCSLLNIERIAAGDFILSVDDNVFRLHSTLSNVRSEIRNCISFGGRKLISIDIKNSQPYLSTAILNHKFWKEPSWYEEKQPTACIYKLSKVIKSIIFQTNKNYNSFIMLCKSSEMQAGSDLQRYKTLVEQGVFYEYLSEEIGKELGIGYSDRKKVKAAVFQVLFTDNRFLGQKEAKPKKVFKTRFPAIYELFSLIKKSDKTNLPRLLQRLESYLMLLVITKRIARERPKLPIFTIHDSIVTTKGNEDYVMQVMKHEMQMAIGIAPTLSIEIWEPANLKFRDGTLYYGDTVIAA